MNLNNENYKRQIVPLVIYLFISLFFVALSAIHFFDPVYIITDKTTGGLGAWSYSVGNSIHSYSLYFTDASAIMQENASLKNKLYNYESLQSLNSSLLKENLALRDQIGANTSSKNHMFLAQITSRSALLDYITVNQGESNGVKKDDVVVYKNILIGIVTDVYPTSSKVQLLTDKDSAVPVVISGTSIDGISSGSISLGIVMNNILPGVNVPVGSSVVTSGLNGGVYPSGLLVGSITQVEPISSQPFQTAIIKPAIDVTGLTYVFIEDSTS